MRLVDFSKHLAFSLLLIQVLPSASQNALTSSPKTTGTPPPIAPTTVTSRAPVSSTGPQTDAPKSTADPVVSPQTYAPNSTAGPVVSTVIPTTVTLQSTKVSTGVTEATTGQTLPYTSSTKSSTASENPTTPHIRPTTHIQPTGPTTRPTDASTGITQPTGASTVSHRTSIGTTEYAGPNVTTSEATTVTTESTTTIPEYISHDGRLGQAILILLSFLGIILGTVNMTVAWLTIWEFQLKHKITAQLVVEKLELAEMQVNQRAFADEILGLLQSIGFDANKYEDEATEHISEFNSQY
ncbi:unnamed protein product [Bursaphelenchus xylophilus]|uniref:(pine wood nematode) hypothetical protein n=1 Tax=Bursaphelenchus xylophilus TaxID=6326 RepID=A0A1I7RVU9_BURXY|nr:unnamed protein product [Bursaphelenchus xylophilus]CAG9082208.1 unnamed protein product [Bursaphelenchus xylophilus]